MSSGLKRLLPASSDFCRLRDTQLGGDKLPCRMGGSAAGRVSDRFGQLRLQGVLGVKSRCPEPESKAWVNG